jgi:hypothetical protein
MEEKMREQKKAAAMAQLAAAQQQAQQYGLPAEKPIAQGVMDQASQQGITNIPSNLPVAGYNDGGIVAFAEGGDAEDFDYEEYQDEQDAEEYNNVLRSYMEQIEAAGLEGIPIHRTKKVEMGVEKKADGGIIGLNAGGAIRFQSRGLVSEANEDLNQGAYANIGPEYDPVGVEVRERLRIENPDAYARMMSSTNTVPEDASPGARPSPFMTGETGNRAFLGYRRPPPGPLATTPKGRELPPEQLPLSALDFDAQSPAVLPTVVVTPEPEVANPEALGSEFGAQGILTPFNAPAGARSATNIGGGRGDGGGGGSGGAPSQGSVRERPKSAFEQFIANVKEERAALDKQKRSDKYMALLTAGLGMMSGTSPNAFANIGQGAQAGVASYAASGKQRAAERAALNKNLLMGQRYQSMEDIAGRTADINEARYKDTLAARMAGAGSSTKAEDQTRKQIADYGRLAETRFRTLSANAQKANQYTDPKGYAAAQNALTNDSELIQYNNIVKRLTNKLYGLSDDTESQNPPAPTNRPPLSSFNR